MIYRIRELREAAGITQEELARSAGCTRATVSMLENSAGNTTTKTLAGIANALNVEIKDLFYARDV